MMNDLIKRYLDLGFWLIPLKNGSKVPHPKLAPNGFYDATRDPAIIEKWHPKLNLGIRTGPESGVVVLDLDYDAETGEPIGISELKRYLEERKIPWPETFTVLTRNGGQHLYFRLPAGIVISSRNRVLPHVDFKADGGYVVAPPSVIKATVASGKGVYEVLYDRAIADVPEWLIGLVTKASDKLDQSVKADVTKANLARPIGAFRLSVENKVKLKDIFLDVYDPSYGFGHDVLLAFFGSLAHRGVSLKDTLEIVALADKTKHITGDFDKQANSTYNTYSENKEVVGLKTLKEIVSQHPDKYPADILQQIDDAYDSIFPPTSTTSVKEAIWEYYIDGNPDTLTSTRVVCTEDGVFIVAKKLTRKGDTYEQPTPVFGRPIILKRIWTREKGDPSSHEFEAWLGDEPYTGTKDEIATKIKQGGVTGVNRNNIDTVIYACVAYNDKFGSVRSKMRYEAIGIYNRDGEWDYALGDVYNAADTDARTVSDYYKPYTGDVKQDLEQFNAVLGYFTNRDNLAALIGAAVIAPLAYVLKGEGSIFFPLIVMRGPPGVGKTTLAELVTRVLYGMPPSVSSDSTSEFRLIMLLDSTTFFRAIDEAVKVHKDVNSGHEKLSSVLKQSVEKQVVASRGNKDKTKTLYSAKTPLIISGNSFNIEDSALLARTLLIPFDSSIEISDSARRRFESDRDRIGEGFGIAFVKHITDHVTIRQLHDKIKGMVFNYKFSDSRRSDHFSIIYTGLWYANEVYKQHGLDFCLSDYLDKDRFLEFVARMEERHQEASKETQFGRFGAEWVKTRIEYAYSSINPDSDALARNILTMLRKDKTGEFAYMNQMGVNTMCKDLRVPELSLSEFADHLAKSFGGVREDYYDRKAKKIKNTAYMVVKVPLADLRAVDDDAADDRASFPLLTLDVGPVVRKREADNGDRETKP